VFFFTLWPTAQEGQTVAAVEEAVAVEAP